MNIKNFFKIILTILVIVLIYLVISSNTTKIDNNDFINKDNNQYLEGKDTKEFIKTDLNNVEQTNYQTKNYNVSFNYLSDFNLVYDKTKFTYSNELNWDQIFFESYSRKQKARFSLDINPDGIGVSIDKKFTVTMGDEERNVVLDSVCEDEICSNDGVVLLQAYWEEKGNTYQFTFVYNTDTESDNIDYEKMFVNIIKSIKIN